jgi:hypothetical protein
MTIGLDLPERNPRGNLLSIKGDFDAMRKQAISISRLVIAALAATALSSTPMSVAQAEQGSAHPAAQCRIVGAISHRCYAFQSDATWREGLVDYRGSNGG